MGNNYCTLLQSKVSMPDVADIQNDIASADNWEEAYWIGRYVFEQASGAADKLIMDAYEKAFELGLNIRVNRECFLTATQQIAKIYFQFRKYDEAINMLMVLDSNVDQLPDWVNLYYASAQIHTENVLYWAEVPEILFRRIDSINEQDAGSVRSRKFLFLEFLNRLSDISKTRSIAGIDKEAILEKANLLGIGESRECLKFKAALGLIKDVPEIPDNPMEGEKRVSVGTVAAYEKLVSQLNNKLADFQAIINKQNLIISQQKVESDDQQKTIEKLQADVSLHKVNYADMSEELKASKEREYKMHARCKALESQLSGSEAARKQLEDDASVIGELRADVEDLKLALTVSRQKNTSLYAEIEHNLETIEQLRNAAVKNQEEVQSLQATIIRQKAQIDVAEAAVKTAEAELKESKERNSDIKQQSYLYQGTDLSADSPAKTTLIDILTVSSFLPRKQKILIIGGSETKEKHLRGKLKSLGFDFLKDQLEFELEYDNVKDYASRIKPWSGKYAGIIVGPCPHKAKDIDGYSSFIEQMKSEEGYPHVEEARDKSGALKISNTSIGEAMLKMAVYLQSIA